MPIVLDVTEDAANLGLMERPAALLPSASACAAEDIPQRVGELLLNLIGPQRYDLWFDRKTRITLAGNALVVEAANGFAANWIRSKFAGELRSVATQVAARPVEVCVKVAEAQLETAPSSPPPPGAAHWAVPPAAPPASTAGSVVHDAHAKTAKSSAYAHAGAPINPKYTLDEFVIGPSNQMAYHAALKVAENPGRQFNPLFLHGNCGLGKTHLLQGICQRFAKLHGGGGEGAGGGVKKWLYITGEQFTNEFLEAIRSHKTDAFRRRIRSADLLVIDDVHFLANKKATQEEFLHTFNQIDAGGKQIVLASDCAPKQIQSLSDPLSSRFVSGMVLRVDSPDLPTRLEILRRRVARNQWNVSDAVLMHIAQSTSSSVRELEGLLLQVVAGIRLINAGNPEAGAALANLKDRTAMRGPVPVDQIAAAVAENFALPVAALMGSGREKIVSLARAIAMHLARQHTGMSYPEIARSLGNKNHSTVIAACQRIEGLLLSSQLLCWNTPVGPRHQSMPDLMHELEAAIRRRK